MALSLVLSMSLSPIEDWRVQLECFLSIDNVAISGLDVSTTFIRVMLMPRMNQW